MHYYVKTGEAAVFSQKKLPLVLNTCCSVERAGMSLIAFERIQELELNAWPDLGGMYRNGWRLRIADGFTGRANSLTALVRDASLEDADLASIEAIYARHGLATSVRITEFVSPGFDDHLATVGYRLRNPSEFRIAELGRALALDPAVTIDTTPPEGWVADFGQLNGRADFSLQTMTAIVGRILLPAGFAALHEDGNRRALGMAVIDRGLMEVQSIVVDETCRGRGLGLRLVESLLAWGRDHGAQSAILSVAADNAPAIRLYSGLGFEKCGGYHYRVKG